MDLAPFHLSYDELACHDAARTPFPRHLRETRLPQLAALFESLRRQCGDKPLRVLSAYRTPEHNAAAGRAATLRAAPWTWRHRGR